jgi:hypothetical protein
VTARLGSGVLEGFACLVRGGHRWAPITDNAGSIVTCARCGQQRHPRPVQADIHHRTHVNLAYQVMLREKPGADVIEEVADE